MNTLLHREYVMMYVIIIFNVKYSLSIFFSMVKCQMLRRPKGYIIITSDPPLLCTGAMLILNILHDQCFSTIFCKIYTYKRYWITLSIKKYRINVSFENLGIHKDRKQEATLFYNILWFIYTVINVNLWKNLDIYMHRHPWKKRTGASLLGGDRV
jgi:hypothetical protein